MVCGEREGHPETGVHLVPSCSTPSQVVATYRHPVLTHFQLTTLRPCRQCYRVNPPTYLTEMRPFLLLHHKVIQNQLCVKPLAGGELGPARVAVQDKLLEVFWHQELGHFDQAAAASGTRGKGGGRHVRCRGCRGQDGFYVGSFLGLKHNWSELILSWTSIWLTLIKAISRLRSAESFTSSAGSGWSTPQSGTIIPSSSSISTSLVSSSRIPRPIGVSEFECFPVPSLLKKGF